MKYSDYLKLVLCVVRSGKRPWICGANQCVHWHTQDSDVYCAALYSAIDTARGSYTFLPDAILSRREYLGAPTRVLERYGRGAFEALRKYLRIEWLRRYIAEVEAAGN